MSAKDDLLAAFEEAPEDMLSTDTAQTTVSNVDFKMTRKSASKVLEGDDSECEEASTEESTADEEEDTAEVLSLAAFDQSSFFNRWAAKLEAKYGTRDSDEEIDLRLIDGTRKNKKKANLKKLKTKMSKAGGGEKSKARKTSTAKKQNSAGESTKSLNEESLLANREISTASGVHDDTNDHSEQHETTLPPQHLTPPTLSTFTPVPYYPQAQPYAFNPHHQAQPLHWNSLRTYQTWQSLSASTISTSIKITRHHVINTQVSAVGHQVSSSAAYLAFQKAALQDMHEQLLEPNSPMVYLLELLVLKELKVNRLPPLKPHLQPLFRFDVASVPSFEWYRPIMSADVSEDMLHLSRRIYKILLGG